MKEKFFANVRLFYEAVVHKMVAKFPWDDKVLRDLVVLDPSKRGDLDYNCVVRLAEQFAPEATGGWPNFSRR